MKKISLFIVAIWLFGACSKQSSSPEYSTEPVITAYLESGNAFALQLSHQQSANAGTYSAPPLDSLQITISTEDSTYMLSPMGNGAYSCAALRLIAEKQYDISFVYNGKVVTASTIIPYKPTGVSLSASEVSIAKVTSSSTPGFPGGPQDPITLTWDNNDGGYYVVVIQNMEVKPERIIDTSVTNIDTSRTFRNKPVIDDTYDLNTNAFKYFGLHRIILYHILPNYALLYDNGTSGSRNLFTPSTGITNGVGIFTGLNADTLYFQVNKK